MMLIYDAAFASSLPPWRLPTSGQWTPPSLPPPSSRIGEVPRVVRGVCLLGVTMRNPVEGKGQWRGEEVTGSRAE